MPVRRVVVVGGGVTGMATALRTARGGAQVTVVERDVLPVGPIEAAPDLSRPGVPRYLQPHAFIPRARLELRRELPDVYDAPLPAGDAYCHTDPTLAHGLAFGLIHGAAIARAVAEHTDVDELLAAARAGEA